MKETPTHKNTSKAQNQSRSFTHCGKCRVVGSPSLRSVPYSNTFDLVGKGKGNLGAKLAKKLQAAFAEALKNPDFKVTNFQAGIDHRLHYQGDYSKEDVENYLEEHKNLIPIRAAASIRKANGEDLIKKIHNVFLLRWTPDEIKKGKKKMIDGKVKQLKDAVVDNTPVKIELVGRVGDQFVEVNETISPDGILKSHEEKMGEVEDEVHFYSRNNAFKALKRFYSALQLHPEKENEPAMAKMVEFFNSQIGLLNKIKNELGVIERVIEHCKPDFDDTMTNIKRIRSYAPDDEMFSTFLEVSQADALTKVRHLIDYLANVINDHSRMFLRSIAEL